MQPSVPRGPGVRPAETYVVGDLQGCLPSLKDLLAQLSFDAAAGDRLWLVGDLVNRGPQSIETLRFVRGMGAAAQVVLGNHDLALIAAVAQPDPRNSTMDLAAELMAAADGAELLNWLRMQPLMHVEGDVAMVHAGLLPSWTIPKAQALAAEVEALLRGANWREFMAQIFGNKPKRWHEDLAGWDRARLIVNAMTRLRFMHADGVMDMKAGGPPEQAAADLMPWYAVTDAAWRSHTVLCGHWSEQGYRAEGGMIALDSGCVWGGALTALRLSDRKVFTQACPAYADWREGG